MTGFSSLLTTAAGAVDTIKQVWYLVVVVVAVHSDGRLQCSTDDISRCSGHHQTSLVSCGRRRRRS